jgi:hypothetical protein
MAFEGVFPAIDFDELLELNWRHACHGGDGSGYTSSFDVSFASSLRE